MHFLNNVKIIGGAQNYHFVNGFHQNLFFTDLTVWRYNKLDLMGDSLYSGSLPAKNMTDNKSETEDLGNCDSKN